MENMGMFQLLPPEIIVMIRSHLPLESEIKLAMTCHQLNDHYPLDDKWTRILQEKPINKAFISAYTAGKIEIVEALLKIPTMDLASCDSLAIIGDAIKKGDLKVVELLAKDQRVNPLATDNRVILSAVDRGQTEMVKILLKYSQNSPSYVRDDSSLFLLAISKGQTEIVRLLLQDNKINVFEALQLLIVRKATVSGQTEIAQLLRQSGKFNG